MTASTKKHQSDREDPQRVKGMKRTSLSANSVPLPGGRIAPGQSPSENHVQKSGQGNIDNICKTVDKGRDQMTSSRVFPGMEDGRPSTDSSAGSPKFRERRRKDKHALSRTEVRHDHDSYYRNEKAEENDPRRKSTSTYDNPQKVKSTGEYKGKGKVLWWRSRSSSSGSLEEFQSGRRERSAVSGEGPRSQRSSSVEEDDGHHAKTQQQSSRAEYGRSSMKRIKGRKGSGERRKRRHRGSSKSNEGHSDQYEQSREHGHILEGRSRGRPLNLKASFEDVDHSPAFLSEEETELSDDSHRQRRGKKPQSPTSSGSKQSMEIEEEGTMEVKSETTLRKERRDKQKTRERSVRSVRSREKEGKKAYYLHVNGHGHPYGDGKTAWKLDLNKLARFLDPSVMDVREQPATNMSTLRRRLRQNFEYSALVDPIFIRQLVGKAISQWRNSLWRKMDARGSCPKGFNEDVWEKLEKTRSCPSHAEKSERMKHANKCRITLGRTGPGGEAGIREKLRLRNGESPDYDKVYTEMQRDKGYGGVAAQRKESKIGSGKIGIQGTFGGLLESTPMTKEGQVEGNMHASTSCEDINKAGQVQDEYVKGLEDKIAELQAAVATISKSTVVSGEKVDLLNRPSKEAEASRENRMRLGDDERTCAGPEGIRLKESNNNEVTVYGREGVEADILNESVGATDARKKLRSHKA